MFILQHLFLMLPGSNLCPGEGDWPDPCYRKGSSGPSLTHKNLKSKSGEIYLSLLLVIRFYFLKNPLEQETPVPSTHTCMYVCPKTTDPKGQGGLLL